MNYIRISHLTLEIVNLKKDIAKLIFYYDLDSPFIYAPGDKKFFPNLFMNIAVCKLKGLEEKLSKEFLKAKK